MADPVILVTADDDHLLLREYEAVLAQLREDHPDADLGIHLAAELDHLPDLRTTSLFGGTTIVVIRGLEDLKDSARHSELKEQIEDYLSAPDPDSILVLVARGTGKIRRIATLAGDVGRHVKAGVPSPWDERGWRDLVGGEFRRARRRADGSAIEAVFSRSGTSAAIIASHVAQICLAHPTVDTITEVEVVDVIEGAGDHGSFAIAGACIEARDPARTVTLTRGAMAAGQEPLMILGLLTAKVRDLMVARAGLDVAESKHRPDRPGAKPRVNPGQLSHLRNASKTWAVGELQWCHDRLATADMALKGNSELPADVVLEMALLDVATRREPGAPWDPRVVG